MATVEEENAQLRETIKNFEEKENSTRKVFDEMKTRLKTALDEKRDFEIEFLQLQKNYLKLKNTEKQLRAQERQSSKADTDKIAQLEAAQVKSDQELKVLKEDNDVLKRQNGDLSEQYREQAKRYDQEEGLD